MMSSGAPTSTNTVVDILAMENLQAAISSKLPALRPGVSPITMAQLPSYIRSCNALSRQHGHLFMHIWRCDDTQVDNNPDSIVLRVIIDDIFVSYLTLGLDGQEEPLTVEFINVFGSRETVCALSWS
jgi:hypothetical protein